MKRYYLHQYGEMVEDKTGEFNNNKHVQQWIKSDDVEKLEKQNREAIKRLRLFCDKVCDSPPRPKRNCENKLCLIYEAILKGEGG